MTLVLLFSGFNEMMGAHGSGVAVRTFGRSDVGLAVSRRLSPSSRSLLAQPNHWSALRTIVDQLTLPLISTTSHRCSADRPSGPADSTGDSPQATQLCLLPPL